MSNSIAMGTRGSKLALKQANWVASNLKQLYPQLKIETKIIKTKGDKILNSPLSKIGTKGLFVKELEDALLNREIDLAVHSMKDVPTDLPKGLIIGAITERIDVRDALISKGNHKLNELASGSLIGTSSLRRKAQLLAFRSDLEIVDLRGNLNTRLKKLEQNELNAIVIAVAGLIRLGLKDKITQILPIDISLPAAGQGALGIEIRKDDDEIKELISNLDKPHSHIAIKAERSFLSELGGGCQIPIGVLGTIEGEILNLKGVIASVDGKKLIRSEIKGPNDAPERIGKELAKKVIELGAREILRNVHP